MNRTKKKKPAPAGPDEHFEALDQLLTQLKTHLTASAGKKGTYGDYLRLLEFYRESRGMKPGHIIVSWVDSETLGTEPLAG
jgi:hypothetical protein